MKFILPLIVFILIHTISPAQKNFSEGFIVHFNGDTAYGKIRDLKTSFTLNAKPIKIKFINKNGEEKTYLANEIKGYCKAGIVNYLSINDLDEGPFFAKILIQGPVTLLSSNVVSSQETYTRYFLKHTNKKFTYEVKAFEFKRDMASYFSDYIGLKEMILNKELRFADMEIIVKKYNEWYQTK